MANVREVEIRPARTDDAGAIVRVYAEGVQAGTATVVTQVPTAKEMAARIRSTWPTHTWLVAERQDEVIGWAATMPYLLVPEYAGVAEFSVYVAGGHQGAGVGARLMTALLEAAEAASIRHRSRSPRTTTSGTWATRGPRLSRPAAEPCSPARHGCWTRGGGSGVAAPGQRTAATAAALCWAQRSLGGVDDPVALGVAKVHHVDAPA